MKIINDPLLALETIDKLQEVLKYTRLNAPSKFSIGERICIHQQIAALYEVQEKLAGGEEEASPKYTLPENIKKKINEVLNWINR